MKITIIKKEEIEKGLIYMVYRGIIPKGADLSPAFENNGKNPLQINMKIEEYEEFLFIFFLFFNNYLNKKK